MRLDLQLVEGSSIATMDDYAEYGLRSHTKPFKGNRRLQPMRAATDASAHTMSRFSRCAAILKRRAGLPPAVATFAPPAHSRRHLRRLLVRPTLVRLDQTPSLHRHELLHQLPRMAFFCEATCSIEHGTKTSTHDPGPLAINAFVKPLHGNLTNSFIVCPSQVTRFVQFGALTSTRYENLWLGWSLIKKPLENLDTAWESKLVMMNRKAFFEYQMAVASTATCLQVDSKAGRV